MLQETEKRDAARHTPWDRLMWESGFKFSSEVAKAADITPSALSAILNGRRHRVRQSTLRLLAIALSERSGATVTADQVRSALMSSATNRAAEGA